MSEMPRQRQLNPSMPAPEADAIAAAEIRRHQAEVKRTKALVRIEKMKAKQSGELKRMPLTGKAALAFIWSK